jgi:hypothetical protein
MLYAVPFFSYCASVERNVEHLIDSALSCFAANAVLVVVSLLPVTLLPVA